MTAAFGGLACSRTIGFHWLMHMQTDTFRLFHCFHCGESVSPLSTPWLTPCQKVAWQLVEKGRKTDFLWMLEDRSHYLRGGE